MYKRISTFDYRILEWYDAAYFPIGEDAISNPVKSRDAVSPCFHEGADSQIFVCARDATTGGSKSIITKADDTDVFIVIVIAISVLPSF